MYQNYITGQTSLTLNLDFSVPENHLINVISTFVDSIPDDVMLETTSDTGRPAYHPAMMLKILLFAYSRRVFSGRKIERMLEENLPMMILAENRKMSYHTINNFRSSDHANEVIKKCFVYFTSLLEDEGLKILIIIKYRRKNHDNPKKLKKLSKSDNSFKADEK